MTEPIRLEINRLGRSIDRLLRRLEALRAAAMIG